MGVWVDKFLVTGKFNVLRSYSDLGNSPDYAYYRLCYLLFFDLFGVYLDKCTVTGFWTFLRAYTEFGSSVNYAYYRLWLFDIFLFDYLFGEEKDLVMSYQS